MAWRLRRGRSLGARGIERDVLCLNEHSAGVGLLMVVRIGVDDRFDAGKHCHRAWDGAELSGTGWTQQSHKLVMRISNT